MASKEVRIIVSAKDQATQIFRRLGIEVEGTTKKLDNFAKTTRRAGRYMTTHLTLPLALAAGRFVKAASDFTETSSKFDAAFGEMADASRDFANQLADDMYRSRTQMQNFMADTMAMTKPILENAKAADTLSRAISALAVDLGSFFNTADVDALEALQSGLTGMTRPLRSYGVVLLESTIQQEALRLGLQKTNQEMSEAEKMALRFVQILRQTQDAQGDAILTGASFENQLKALKSSFADLSVEIGQELMPYALAAVKWARDMIEAFRSLEPETRQTIIQFAGIVAIAGPLTLALSSIVKGIVLTGKALYSVAKFAANHPYVFLATVAAALAMQIDAVQEAIERLMRSLGLGVIYDTIDAFEELSKAASGIVFDPNTAGADEMKKYYQQWQEEFEKMLKEGVFAKRWVEDNIVEELKGQFSRMLLNIETDFLGIPADNIQKILDQTRDLRENIDQVAQGALYRGEENVKELTNVLERFNDQYRRLYAEYAIQGRFLGSDLPKAYYESLIGLADALEKTWVDVWGKIGGPKENKAGHKVNILFSDIIQQIRALQAVYEREVKFNEFLAEGLTAALMGDDLSRIFQDYGRQAAESFSRTFISEIRKISFDPQKFGITISIDTSIENLIKALEKGLKELGKDLVAAASLGARLGGGGTGASIGSALGSAVGSAFGPIGTALGSIAGGLFGGLFDNTGKPSKAITVGLGNLRKEIEEFYAGGEKYYKNWWDKLWGNASRDLAKTLYDLGQAFGTSVDDISSALASAFSADTYEEFVAGFSQSIEEMTHDALVKAFMAQRLYPIIEDLYEEITKAAVDSIISPEERARIIALQTGITAESEDFFNILKDLGIAVGDVTDNMNELSGAMRNVPQGFKYALESFRATTPTPGYIPPSAGSSQTIIFNGDVYGYDDFARKVNEATAQNRRTNSLTSYGLGGVY